MTEISVGTETYVYGTPGLVPTGVVTVTGTVPVPGGAIAMISVLEIPKKNVAGVAPNLTEVTPVKPVPTIKTTVPPVDGPELGMTEATTGGCTT
nr:hypothetical protein [Nocardia exalbida]